MTSSTFFSVTPTPLRLRAIAWKRVATSLTLTLLIGTNQPAMAEGDFARWSRQRSAVASPAAFLTGDGGSVYLYEPSGDDRLLRIRTGSTRMEIRSTSVRAKGRIHGVTSVGDLDDDGIRDIALVKTGDEDSAGRIVLLESASGSSHSVRPLPGREPLGLISLGSARAGALLGLLATNDHGSVSLHAFRVTPDGLSPSGPVIGYPTITDSWAALSLPWGAGEDSADVAVFGVSVSGETTVAVRDSSTGERGSPLSFGARLVAVDVIALPDVFPDGSPELAVLGEADDGRLVGVIIKELGSGKTVARYRFSPNQVPMRLLHIPTPGGAGMLGVIGQRGNGSIALQRRNLDTGKALENVRFRAHYAPDDAALLKLPGTDRGGNVAITGFDAFGRGRLEVRDATTGELMLDHDLRQADE